MPSLRWWLPTTMLLASSPALAIPDPCDAFGALDQDEAVSTADTLFGGDGVAENAGFSVANLGDLNGDGLDDVGIGVPGDDTNGNRAGAVLIFYGPVGALGMLTEADADVAIYGPAANAQAGWSIAGGEDIDQDGRDDLVIGSATPATGAYGAGRAWVVLGSAALPPVIDLSTSADATLVGGANGDRFGESVALGDVDGDGSADVLIGAPGESTGGNDRGAAYLFSAPALGTFTAPGADATWAGAMNNGDAGHSVAIVDLDSDGFGEAIVGALTDSTTGSRAGAAYIVYGDLAPTSGVLPTVAATALLGGQYDRAGSALAWAGDVDGDGYADLWVGAQQFGSVKRGAAYLIPGGAIPIGVSSLELAATARIRGFNANDLLGSSLAGGVDIDADGYLDAVLGAKRADSPTSATAGAAYVVHGPFAGDFVVDPSSGRLYGAGNSAFAGGAVAMFPDLNGDGFGDVLVGMWRANTLANKAGVAGLFLGGQDIADESTSYADLDGDGWGDPGNTVFGCGTPGFITFAGDCNDGNSAIHPYAPETDCLDPIDYNCDGSVGTVDLDGDGQNACSGDCDDNDAAVLSTADEVCADRIDNDCDGLTDDGSAIDALVWYPDVDNDSYGDQAFGIPSCDDPGTLLDEPVFVGGDCDDLVSAVNPSVGEYCDGIDNDCNEGIDEPSSIDAGVWYDDSDGDGHGDWYDSERACSQPIGRVSNPTDCDDDNSAIRPGGTEVCDELDNDCDGLWYRGGWEELSANLELTGEAPGGKLGDAVAMVPDMDGDGLDEVAAGAMFANLQGAANAGVVYIFSGNADGGGFDLGDDLGGGATTWTARITSDRASGRFGSALAGGDFNGDGIGDLAVGAHTMSRPSSNQGGVFVFYGPLTGELDLDDADVVFHGAGGGDQAGFSLDAGDLDGDGFADLLVGANRAEGAGTRRGAVYAIYGSGSWADGRLDLVADAELNGVLDRDQLGTSVAILGDIDGDGSADLGAGGLRAGSLDRGVLEVVLGTSGRHTGALGASVTITSAAIGERLALDLDGVGDVNGDGQADVLVGSNVNKAYVLYGGGTALTSGGDAQTTADVVIEGRPDQFVGKRVAAGGDIDGDGFADILLSAQGDDEGDLNAGAIVIVYGGDSWPAAFNTEDLESFGRRSGGVTWSAANLGGVEGAVLYGTEEGARLGTDITGEGDLNGDGFPDVVAGATRAANDLGMVVGVFAGPYGLDAPSVASTSPTPVSDDYSDYWPDRDLDEQGEDGSTPVTDCEMHVPYDFTDPFDITFPWVDDISVVTDCDDADDSIYLGAPDVAGDGIDSDCNGDDAPNLPPVVSICEISPEPSTIPAPPVLSALATASDPDGDPVTISYSWLVNGLAVTPALETQIELGTDYVIGDSIELVCVANDGITNSVPAGDSGEVDESLISDTGGFVDTSDTADTGVTGGTGDTGSDPGMVCDLVSPCDPVAMPFGGGDGSAGCPFLICTPDHLANVGSTSGTYFALTSSIDMAATSYTAANLSFGGGFDGRGHVISNLTAAVGMFDYVGSGASVHDLELSNLTITAGVRTGGVVSFLDGEISGVEISSGSVTGASNDVGGLAGIVQANGIVDNCTSYASVSSTDGNVGGAAGIAQGRFSDVRVYGDVTSTSGVAGGFAGQLRTRFGFPADNCRAEGNVSTAGNFAGGFAGIIWDSAQGTRLSATGDATSGQRAGGFTAWMYNSSTLSESYAIGDATAPIAGGFVGELSGADITDSYSMGTATQTGTVSGCSVVEYTVGGFIGRVRDQAGTSIQRSVGLTTAVVAGGSPGFGFQGGAYVSGCYTPATLASVTNSYFYDVPGVSADPNPGITAVSAAPSDEASWPALDFVTVWGMPSANPENPHGVMLPVLRWQCDLVGNGIDCP